MIRTFSLKSFCFAAEKYLLFGKRAFRRAQMYVVLVLNDDPYVKRIFSFKFVGKSQFFFISCRRINHSGIFVQLRLMVQVFRSSISISHDMLFS